MLSERSLERLLRVCGQLLESYIEQGWVMLFGSVIFFSLRMKFLLLDGLLMLMVQESVLLVLVFGFLVLNRVFFIGVGFLCLKVLSCLQCQWMIWVMVEMIDGICLCFLCGGIGILKELFGVLVSVFSFIFSQLWLLVCMFIDSVLVMVLRLCGLVGLLVQILNGQVWFFGLM